MPDTRGTHDTFFVEAEEPDGSKGKYIHKVVNGRLTPKQFEKHLRDHGHYKKHQNIVVHPVKSGDKNLSFAELVNAGPPDIHESELREESAPVQFSINEPIELHHIAKRLTSDRVVPPSDEEPPTLGGAQLRPPNRPAGAANEPESTGSTTPVLGIPNTPGETP